MKRKRTLALPRLQRERLIFFALIGTCWLGILFASWRWHGGLAFEWDSLLGIPFGGAGALFDDTSPGTAVWAILTGIYNLAFLVAGLPHELGWHGPAADGVAVALFVAAFVAYAYPFSRYAQALGVPLRARLVVCALTPLPALHLAMLGALIVFSREVERDAAGVAGQEADTPR